MLVVIMENQVSDLSPLADLVNLTEFNGSGNKIEDLSILSQLNALDSLGLSNNLIEDISPIKDLKLIKRHYQPEFFQ